MSGGAESGFYSLRDDGVRRVVTRRLLQFAPAYFVISIVFAFGRSPWPPSEEDSLVFAGLIGISTIAMLIGWFQAQDPWAGFRVEIEGGRIRRTRPYVSDQEWSIHETRYLGWTSHGDLVLRGPAAGQEIQIPPEIDGFPALLATLSRDHVPDEKPPIGAALEYVLIVCALMAVLSGLMFATDPRLLLSLGVTGLLVFGKATHGLLRHPNVLPQARHHALHLLVPLLLCVVAIVRAVMAWHG